jgi:hypothetical protein
MQRALIAIFLSTNLGACASDQQTAGTATGAVAGAVVGGPVGAVVGGVAPATVTAPGAATSRIDATAFSWIAPDAP